MHRLPSFDVPPVIEVAGNSMAPTLPRGTRVRIQESAVPWSHGDVVLFRTPSGLLLHRVIHVADFRGGRLVFHRGDGGGGIGCTTSDAALGVATGVLLPAVALDLGLASAGRAVRRSFRTARTRCRIYAHLRHLAEGLGLAGGLVSRVAGIAGTLLLGRSVGGYPRSVAPAAIVGTPAPAADRAILRALVRGEPMPRDAVADATLLEAADRHGLLPLLAHSPLARELPVSLRRPLRTRSVLNASRAQAAVRELARLAREFAAADLPLLSWKGPALAAALYGDPSLRSFADLDLMVAPSDLERAERLLSDLGYQPGRPVTGPQLRSLRRSGAEREFVAGGQQHVIDLHWRFTTASFPLALSFGDAWQEHVDWASPAGPVATLGLTHLVITTAAHAAKHLWWKLEMLVSIGRFAERGDLDWEAVDALAGRLHARRPLGLSFLLAEQFLGTPPPPIPAALAAARPAVAGVARLVEQNLFAATPHAHAEWRDLPQLLDRRRDVWRARAVAAFVPTYPDWEATRLPAGAGWLYWLVRPLRLAWKYLGGSRRRA